MRDPGNEVNCKSWTHEQDVPRGSYITKNVVGGVRHNLAMKLRTRT